MITTAAMVKRKQNKKGLLGTGNIRIRMKACWLHFVTVWVKLWKRRGWGWVTDWRGCSICVTITSLVSCLWRYEWPGETSYFHPPRICARLLGVSYVFYGTHRSWETIFFFQSVKAILRGSLRPGPEGCYLEMLIGLVLYITQVVTLRSATEGHAQCPLFKVGRGRNNFQGIWRPLLPCVFPTDQSYLQCVK